MNACGSRRRNLQLFVCDYTQATADDVKQFARLQQEIRIRRLAKAFVAGGEGFIDEHAARCQGVENAGKQGPVQIVGDHDAVELQTVQRPGAAFQVGVPHRNARYSAQGIESTRIAVHGANLETQSGEKAGVAATAAGKIKHRAAWRNTVRPAFNPLRGLIGAVHATQCRSGSHLAEVIRVCLWRLDFTVLRSAAGDACVRDRFDTSEGEC